MRQRIAIVVTLLGLGWGLGVVLAPTQAGEHQHYSVAAMQQHVTAQFRHFNDGYFDGKLPKTTVHYAEVPNEQDVIGFSVCDMDDDAGPTTCEIWVVPHYNIEPMSANLTLAHEMCHVALYGKEFDDHGPVWQGCMKRLAVEGAFEGSW